MMSCFKRGEKVEWTSPVSHSRSKAIFVGHDVEGLPKRDALLAIGIGMKGNRMTHTFRWPLKLISRS